MSSGPAGVRLRIDPAPNLALKAVCVAAGVAFAGVGLWFWRHEQAIPGLGALGLAGAGAVVVRLGWVMGSSMTVTIDVGPPGVSWERTATGVVERSSLAPAVAARLVREGSLLHLPVDNRGAALGDQTRTALGCGTEEAARWLHELIRRACPAG